MTHKCEYCDNTINPCMQPCHNLKCDSKHVCCTCPDEKCELPQRIVCDTPLCNLKYQIDWYKIKLTEAHDDISKLKALNNQFRIVNIGSQAAQRLIEDGTLEISGIKLFVSKQKLTWENIPIETGYILLTLHDEFAKAWAGFLNEKAVKVQIKKELIAATDKKLAKAQEIREGKLNADESQKKATKVKYNDFEKIVAHYVKIGMNLDSAINHVKSMGINGEIRPETKFN